MREKLTTIAMTGVTTLVILAFAGLAGAGPLARSSLQGGVPLVVSYQGQVTLDGSPYDGDGYFKFGLVDEAGTTYWSNDDTSTGEPEFGVPLHVTRGLFNVLLGDDSLEYMVPLEVDAFRDTDRYLRVWFSRDGVSYQQLSPDRRVAAAPYALQAQEAQVAANADTVDGLHASAFANATHSHTPGQITPQGSGSGLDADTVDGLNAGQLGSHYQNVVVVAKSGGDYVSVQAAIDSITDATAGNPYLVWVAPGVYEEQVTMKPFVHLQGAGQEATIITSAASDSAWPPTQATLVLASDISLRDLTIGNNGAGDYDVALLATAGVARTLVAGVTAQAQGDGMNNYAVYLGGSGVDITLRQVTALGENGAANYGLYSTSGAAARLRGGSFIGRGGTLGRGICSTVSTILDAEGITALGESGTSNYGLYNTSGATATLRGGSFTGRLGTSACGIYNGGGGADLEAESVTALGESGTNFNHGLHNYWGDATLRGGSFTGRGGTDARGICNSNGATLETEGVTALGESGTNNYGLYTTGTGTAYIAQSVLEGATNSVYYDESGDVTVSNSRLVGGVVHGYVICTLVTRDTLVSTDGFTCP
jgi:hypothetical protein